MKLKARLVNLMSKYEQISMKKRKVQLAMDFHLFFSHNSSRLDNLAVSFLFELHEKNNEAT